MVVLDLNATKDAIRAGYAPKRAYAIGMRTCKNLQYRPQSKKQCKEASK